MRATTTLRYALAAALLTGSATARDLYVSATTGSNDNPGTKEAPMKLLWRAMSELQKGDYIRVAEGVYRGQKKSGVMPKITVGPVTIEGGWKADFSERNPFKYLSIITGASDVGGSTGEVFQFEDPDGKGTPIVLDGFCIDRGTGNAYYGHGEGGTDKQEGYSDSSPWGYQAINKKMSGSDPAIELLGKGSFTVRNMLIVNNPWWGIYIKGGGSGEIVIENNFILGYQGRGIEAIAGGGWGKPKFIIRNNTVAFGCEMEGRALSLDPRPDYSGSYLVTNNVLLGGMQGGIMTKFTADTLVAENNLIFGFRGADYGQGGSPTANIKDWEDEVTFKNKKNVHEAPKFLAGLHQAWVDRWSQWEGHDSQFFTSDDVMAARKAAGLEAYGLPFFPGKSYASYKELPQGRINFQMSRYPHPFKSGQELMDWTKSILPALGMDGERGVQATPVGVAAAVPATGAKPETAAEPGKGE